MSEAIRIPGGFRQFAFVHGEPGCSAQIKQEFEDFQVDEELGFAPLGSGEHLLVRVCKQDMGTLQAAAGLARELGVSPAAVGYSGMKDRRAITTQWFSVPQKTGSRLRPGTDLGPGLRILEIHGNDRKLRIGSHRANRFRIRLRHLRDEGRELETRLMRIRAEGVPNYFGPQRLGREFSNVSQAQETFLAFDENKGRLRPARKKKSMLLSAARSFLFNAVLSHRVAEASWNRRLAGEVFNLEGTRRLFRMRDEDDTAVLDRRIQELDIHPTGLLAGKIENSDPYQAGAAVARLEADILNAYPVLGEGLVREQVASSRRALRLLPRDLELIRETDEMVTLSFTLGAGGYGTALLRELVRF